MSDYPEHDKLHNVKDDSQKIGEFIDWLQNEKEMVIAHWGTDEWDETLLPDHRSIEVWLAEYFEIDLQKVEDEKRQMLDQLRKRNEEEVKTDERT